MLSSWFCYAYFTYRLINIFYCPDLFSYASFKKYYQGFLNKTVTSRNSLLGLKTFIVTDWRTLNCFLLTKSPMCNQLLSLHSVVMCHLWVAYNSLSQLSVCILPSRLFATPKSFPCLPVLPNQGSFLVPRAIPSISSLNDADWKHDGSGRICICELGYLLLAKRFRVGSPLWQILGFVLLPYMTEGLWRLISKIMFRQRFKDAELSSIIKVTCKHVIHLELGLSEMPQSRDNSNISTHLGARPSLQGRCWSTTSHPSHGGTRQSRQFHPVCAFVYPPPTLRNINKCTDGQACSML